MKEYVSISEYAKVTKTSTTAVYKNKGLEPFRTVVNGVKSINIRAMAESNDERFKTVVNLFNQPFQTVSNPVSTNENDTANETKCDAESNADLIAFLKDQLKQKDRQIETQQQTISDLTHDIAELTKLVDQAQKLQGHTQMLLDNPKKKNSMLDGFKSWWNSTADMNTEK